MSPDRSPVRQGSRRRGRWSALALVLAALVSLGPASAAAPAAVAPAPAAVGYAQQPSPQFRAVAERLADEMPRLGVPGGVLGITIDGRTEVATLGVADLDAGAPVARATRFALGSITKTYTGTAVMRLVDQGRIDLDAPVRTYVPDLRLADESVAQRVTVRDLMTHSGNWWGDGFVDTGDGDDALARFVAEHLPTAPQLAPLGPLTSYNNAGFSLLGHVVERVTGKPYRAAMAELVLEPLGLDATTFDPAAVLAGPHATGYGPGSAGIEAVTPLFLPAMVDPAGGAWAGIDDLLRYARFHMGDGTVDGRRVMSAQTLALMQTPTGRHLDGADMGLYWPMVTLPDGSCLLTHNGGTFGEVAHLSIVPQRRFAVAALFNSTTGGELLGLALSAALAGYLDVPEPELPTLEPLPLTPEQLAEYTGRYDTPTDTLVLRVAGGALLLTDEYHPPAWQVGPSNARPFPPDLPVWFVAPDVALVGSLDPAQALPLIVVRRPDGSVGWLSVGGRLFPRAG
jgi:CubicO group peptidase (beta-lactamase class C family)